jgi:hypothetical protein
VVSHQTKCSSDSPQGFNRTPTVEVFQELETIAGHRIIAAPGTEESTVAIPVIEAKAIYTSTPWAGTVLVAQGFDRNAQFGQEFQPAPASNGLDC